MLADDTGIPVDLTCLDEAFAQRMPAEEWARIKVIRDAPTLFDALDVNHALLSPYYADHLLLNKVVTEGRRFEMLVYLLYLEATVSAEDPRSGLTNANFRRICVRQNVCSPNRASVVLGIMRLAGFVTDARDDGGDARVARLAVTPKFMETVEGWNQAMLTFVDAAVPGDDLAGAHARIPGLGRGMRINGGRALLDGWHLLPPFPEARMMIDRDGGWMLLMHLAYESLRQGQRRVIAPVSVDLAAFGRRFGVSRSHLRRLLEEVHQAGLLAAPPRNGAHIQLTPQLLASYMTCLASEIDFYRRMTLAALADLQPA
ncbi:hypothetical protein CA606_11995 [Caulobacter vibrioides]|uniref:Uncharacterized protein n=1 Tax=Caulobacter vibrioides TaxID=155892 RepID=A0A290MLV4_CAUVI|nr:hypothetical protein [Caulobacter vibrioides]ATC32991.1 hypothetical protein CA606_11995 [Caulobacter vibrioides]